MIHHKPKPKLSDLEVENPYNFQKKIQQPSPIKNGFNPETKKWKTQEGKENYFKDVVEYAKYVSYNQNEIKERYATITVNENCPQQTIEALEALIKKKLEHEPTQCLDKENF